VHPAYADLEAARGSDWRKGKRGRQVWSKYKQVLAEVRQNGKFLHICYLKLLNWNGVASGLCI
jgi:hypothetical protein